LPPFPWSCSSRSRRTSSSRCWRIFLALAYLLFLKRKLLVDMLGLAAIHTLRILAGNAAAAIAISSWLLAFAMFLFLSLALVKRYAELRLSQDQSGLKKAGRGYQAEDIEALSQLGMASGCTCALIMALYVDSANVKQLYSQPKLIWLICPIVLYQMARIWFPRRQMPDDPLVFMIRDWRSQFMGLLVVLIMVAATFVPVTAPLTDYRSWGGLAARNSTILDARDWLDAPHRPRRPLLAYGRSTAIPA
jgi:4-hydroxybenzoate polyprenyltransferase